MRVIGITGGVGSGKSEILRLLKEEFGAKLPMRLWRREARPAAGLRKPSGQTI